MAVSTKIQHRRDTAANWTSTNPTLASGEIGFETDTLKFKVGNGSTAWTSLKYSQDASLLTGNASITTLTTTGDINTAGKLNVTASSGDEGGEIFLANAVTNTSINNGVTIDVYQNRLRFFEQGGSARGYYIDITGGGAGATTNLAGGGGGTGTVTSITASSPLTGGTITTSGTIGINASSTNTANYVVQRDASGNFAANTVTASLTGTASLATNLVGGTTNKGEIVYQSGVNTTAELTAPTTNNVGLHYNTSTNAPFWVQPTLSNTYYAATTSAQLAGTISDETGSGSLVFSTNPSLDGMTLNAGTSLIVEDADSVVGRVIGSGNVLYIQAGADSTDGTGHIFVGRYANSNPVANITLNGTTTNVATNLVVGGTANIAGQITSTLANGTAPFVVTSTTQVANLNVAVSGLTVNVIGGTANKGELLYQSGVNTTAELTAPATNNSILGYNTSTNAPFWVSPTLSNTYFAATTSAQLAGVVSDETGTGNLVFSTSPTLTTPRLANSTTTATAGLRDFDGTVFYSTTSTTPGKALDVASYYYVSSASYDIDATTGAFVRSLLGGSNTGITVDAGTTYEYEGLFVITGFFVATSQTPTINLNSTTVTLSPVVTHQTVVESGNNATGLGSASTLSAYRFTSAGNGIALTALTTGSRYYTVKMRGRIAVTGTGTAEIQPTIRFSQGSTDNDWTVEQGAIFRMTPIGNGTVTTVGTWA
jgi:hypothetical protein